MEQQPDGTFVSRFKRVLSDNYTAEVFVSNNLKRAAIKLKSNRNADVQRFDIFKGLDKLAFFAKGPEFKEAKGKLDRNAYNNEYIATIELPITARVSRFCYSANNRFVGTFSSD